MKSFSLPENMKKQGYELTETHSPNGEIRLALSHSSSRLHAVSISGVSHNNAFLLIKYDGVSRDEDVKSFLMLFDVWKKWGKIEGYYFLEINKGFPLELLSMDAIIDHPVNPQSYLLPLGEYTFAQLLSLYQSVHACVKALEEETEESFTMTSRLNEHVPYRKVPVFVAFTELAFEGSIYEQDIDFQLFFRSNQTIELSCNVEGSIQTFPIDEAEHVVREYLLTHYRKHRLSSLFQ